MLRKIVFSSLLILTMLDASSIESEIGINVGMNSTQNEGANQFENPIIGITYQDNRYVVSPRVDLEYTNVKDDRASALVKGSINGVYEYENHTNTTPYALAGIGYEYVSGGEENVFESHPFVQAGAGLRMDLNEGYKVRVEGRFLQILGGEDENHEAMITAGISIPLVQNRPVKKIRRVVRPKIKPLPPKRCIAVINSNNNECPIKINRPDFDRDGIENRLDQCPNTPCGFTIDAYGCPIKTTLKINFASNSAEITGQSFPRINQFVTFLLQNRESSVQIVGHTDSVGSAQYNLALSEQRASSVRTALIQNGISPSRVHAIGRGETMPIASNKTSNGRRINRRIEAVLSYPRGRK